MFNPNTSADTKIAVLEERLSSYELMLKRIDEAIQLMGKTNQNISKMLAVHEEKIEQCGKADDYIGRVIEELRLENRDQHLEVEKRIDELETKIDEITKFRWIVIGAAIIVSFFISNSGVMVEILTPDPQPAKVETMK
jgi:predicted ribosome quality control (RQC) complex YloA/Tae2 family protein